MQHLPEKAPGHNAIEAHEPPLSQSQEIAANSNQFFAEALDKFTSAKDAWTEQARSSHATSEVPPEGYELLTSATPLEAYNARFSTLVGLQESGTTSLILTSANAAGERNDSYVWPRVKAGTAKSLNEALRKTENETPGGAISQAISHGILHLKKNDFWAFNSTAGKAILSAWEHLADSEAVSEAMMRRCLLTSILVSATNDQPSMFPFKDEFKQLYYDISTADLDGQDLPTPLTPDEFHQLAIRDLPEVLAGNTTEPKTIPKNSLVRMLLNN